MTIRRTRPPGEPPITPPDLIPLIPTSGLPSSSPSTPDPLALPERPSLRQSLPLAAAPPAAPPPLAAPDAELSGLGAESATLSPEPVAAAESPPPVEAPSPVVAALSPPRVELSREIVARFQPDTVRAESIRAIRTYLIAQHLHEGRRALAVCAASEGVGCTFVAANLAYVLAQAGVNTLLIDGDLREPSLEKMYVPAERHAGLAQCLAVRDENFGDYITPGVAPNLSILYSGGTADHPQELLAGAHFKALMDFCLREYDFTIIDTPPANLCADGRRIRTVAGYAIIVAARDVTFAEDVKTLASQIEGDHARVVGTILNQA